MSSHVVLRVSHISDVICQRTACALSRACFTHALALNPKSGWSWFEVARWEREMVTLENRRDPRTKDTLEDQSLSHFRLALRHIAGGSGPGLQSVIDIAHANIRDLEARHAKHRH
jgi:hypothetical protein